MTLVGCLPIATPSYAAPAPPWPARRDEFTRRRELVTHRAGGPQTRSVSATTRRVARSHRAMTHRHLSCRTPHALSEPARALGPTRGRRDPGSGGWLYTRQVIAGHRRSPEVRVGYDKKSGSQRPRDESQTPLLAYPAPAFRARTR